MRESANLKLSTEDAMNTDSKSHSPSIAVDSNNSNKRLKPNQDASASNKVDESNKSSLESAVPESSIRCDQNIDRNQVSSSSSNLMTHASPSVQAPLNSGMTKDIRLVKLSDKAWMCDVCKRAVFENFVEACMHEIACKSIKSSRRNSSEASLNINMMTQLARRNSFTYGQTINCSSTGSNGTLPSSGPIVFPGVATVASYTNPLNRNSIHNLNGMMHQLKMIANPAPGSINQAVFPAVHGNPLVSSVNSGAQGKIISSKYGATDISSASSPSNIVNHSGSNHDVSLKSGVNMEISKADHMALTLESEKSAEIKSDSLNAGVSISSNSGTSVTSYSSAKSHEESSDESKEENDGTQVDISLIPENKNLLSDYNYLLTKNIELFQVPLSFNVAQMNVTMAEELPATKVGLRCIHCSSSEHQITASSFFPSSVSSMASGIGTIGSRHMIGGKCPLLPKSVLHELKEAKLNSQQQSRIPGKVALDAYCKDLAKSHKIFDHEVSSFPYILII